MLPERTGNFQEIVKSDVAFAAFNSADVRRVQFRGIRKLLLGPALCEPKFSDGFPKLDSVRVFHRRRSLRRRR
jgi:hypothetical protein